MKDKFTHLNLPAGTIRLAVTSRCNMDCFYCHNEGQDKKKLFDLDFDSFKTIIDVSEKFGLRGISFSGGEPFLNKDFPKMIEHVVNMDLPKIDICTNGILVREYIGLLKTSKNINLVIGIDTCNPEKISKQSKIGKTFEYIEQNIKIIKEQRVSFSINTVYSGKNSKEVYEIAEYCKKNEINIRIIEMDTYQHIADSKVSPLFGTFIKKMAEHFDLDLGYAHPGKGFYSRHSNGSEIYFYHSKCHIRDCINCGRCHFRIDAAGQAIPCYSRNFKIPLLKNDSEESYANFLSAIYNLGISPEEEKKGTIKL